MKILTQWLRTFVPGIPVDDHQLAEALTLRGIAVEGVHDLGAGQGHLFEMDITTNRVDAMNHYGIAREAATIYDLPLTTLDSALTRHPAPHPSPVRIEEPALCGRFTAQILRNIAIAPSSGVVAEYFQLLGQKLISNAVDASNFVLLGMGHPTHAFDLDTIDGGIVVRLARAGERIRLLDGTERTLHADDLVVADDKKPLALAGVMGGFDSMITPRTRNILVEAAWFDPGSVRRSARRHLLHTDASHRFERGADFSAAPIANGLVSRLILQHGGTAEGDLIDLHNPEIAARTATRPPIHLALSQVQRHLGSTIDPQGITPALVEQYLTSLGCTLAPEGPDRLQVHLPSWRLDLEREIDLLEEVARVYGYNRFANTLPTPSVVVAHPTASAEAAVRSRLLALGYTEAISSTFASQADSNLFAHPNAGLVALENPLSDEATLLRPSLVPGMAAMLAHNLNRDVRTVRLFEQGHVFTGSADRVDEAASLSLGLTGTFAATPIAAAADAPFYELKGILESLFALFDSIAASLAFSADAPAWLQPGRSATALLGTTPVAHFGELAATEARARKLRQPVFLATVDLAHLYTLPLRKVTAQEISRFQAVERDFSFSFPGATDWQSIASAIDTLAIPDLTRFNPVEIFHDGKSASGRHSLLLRCVFQSSTHTLTDEELTQHSSAIVHALTHLGGTLRTADHS